MSPVTESNKEEVSKQPSNNNLVPQSDFDLNDRSSKFFSTNLMIGDGAEFPT